MKERIVFMLIDMNIGGTEKALLNMISSLSRDHYTITVFLLLNRGGLLHALPDDVEVICFDGFKDIAGKINYAPRKVIIKLFKSNKYLEAVRLLFLHIVLKITKDRRIFFRAVLKKYPKLNREFDIAIAYAGPMDFISYYVLNKINAQKKIQWIHFDVTKIGFDKRFATRVYNHFDKIFVVSKEGKGKLKAMVPKLSDKIEAFPNLIQSKEIIGQVKSGQGFKDNFEGIKILTVGRLAIEKGQDLSIKALSRLNEDGYKVKWYCIGEGEARGYYEKLINEYKLQDKFILLGADPNPYPYISQCDLYVQSSRHEGYCITLAEARILRKPIVTTNFTGAKEQIKDEETGLIVDTEVKYIYQGIKKLITNQNLCERFSENLAKENDNKLSEINKYFTTPI